ncbi:hypothetical protein [uncultured Tyzzerella sp.]|uniref:hypothetical protein n=1 Tax=uncultured Tyzzerella sp. TaxID=2321398 RepID=UPI0029421FF3|nr:hypothetical protein [uncultured Tyzzerella sp.]
MTSNHLSFKLFKEEYKKYIWALALTIVGFIFSKIILPLLDYSNYLREKKLGTVEDLLLHKLKSLNTYLTIDNEFNKVIVIGLSVIMGTVIFSYLHSKKKVDFYHSLPILRSKLFFLKYILGISIVVPVIIISQVILYTIFKVILGSEIVAFKEVLEAIMVDTIIFILLYSITVFANVLAGNTIIGFILSTILINLFSIVSIVIITLSGIFFSPIIELNNTSMYQLIYNPLIFYISLMDTNIYLEDNKISILIGYVVATIIIGIVSLILFKVRKSEKSGECISFKYAKTIFKYLGVCSGSFLVGFMFCTISYSTFTLYLGIIIGCIILHCLVEIIYEFDFRAIFKNWYSIIGCIAICIVVTSIYQFDIFKRLEYVPSIEKVENISIDFMGNSEEAKNIDNKEIIQSSIQVHKNYVETGIDLNRYVTNGVKLTYKLKNGNILSRFIGFDYEDLQDENSYLQEILNSKEYIEQAYPAIYRTDIHIDKMYLINNKGDTIDLRNDKKLLDNIRKDIEENGIYSQNEEALFKVYFGIYRAWEYDFRYGENAIYINSNYKNTLKYLESLNIYPQDIKLEDVKYINIEDIKIEDKEDIKNILEEYKVSQLLQFNQYKDPTVYTVLYLVDKEDRRISITVSAELYKGLEQKYKID